MIYDLALFEQLNEEYRDRPIVGRSAGSQHSSASPLQQSAPVVAKSAADVRTEYQRHAVRTLLTPILRDVDLTGKVVLELGCLAGWLTSVLPDHAQAAAAIGIGPRRHASWDEHTDPRVTFIEADLAIDRVLEPASIDTVISVARFEHLTRPLQTLAALYELLKEGGEAWLRIDPYGGRTASHRYKEIFFPWPHLLFDDDVCEEFYQKHYERSGQRFVWSNRLTVAHYVRAARHLGFAVTLARRKAAPIDVPFYLRFLDKLERYAALDLETDSLTLVLWKQAACTDDATHLDIDYVARQRELDQSLRQFLALDDLDADGQPSAIPAAPRTASHDRDSSPDPDGPVPTEGSAAEPEPAPTTGPNINTPSYWDDRYRREWESGQVFSATYARDYGPIHEAILNLIPEGGRVLDVACGAGVLCRKIKRRLPATSVMGVDFSAYTITRNQRTDRGLGNEYRCLDVQTSLPSLARAFDVVIMAEIIEHLDDPRRAVTDAVGLLQPGGRLIITCPHDDRIPSAEHVRQWGHDELFHFLSEYSDTVCFTGFRAPYDRWMMAHLTKPS